MSRCRYSLIALAMVLLAALAGAAVAGAPTVVTAPTAAPLPTPPLSNALVPARPAMLDLWARGQAAFGVFVPDERPRAEGDRGRRQPPLYTLRGGEELGRNPLYDFVFLNLEGGYDAGAVRAIADGLTASGEGDRVALLVRIPPIARDGEAQTRERVEEILAAGADGVVFPHVRGPQEATLAVSMMRDAGAELWSADNLSGDRIAMIMIEDPRSLAQAAQTAEVPGIGILACGIGSLRRALGGDAAAAEEGVQEVLAHARRIGAVDMITAGARDVEERVRQGFLALLMSGAGADEAIQRGRAVVGR